MLRKPLSCERVRVNWEHPLNRGLVAWWLMNEGAGTIARSCTGLYGATFTSGSFVGTISGMALSGDGGVGSCPTKLLHGLPPLTFAVRVRKKGAPDGAISGIIGCGSGLGNERLYIGTASANGTTVLDFGTGGSFKSANINNKVESWFVIVGFAPLNDMFAYQDDVLINSGLYPLSEVATGNNYINLLTLTGAEGAYNCNLFIVDALYWSRALNPAEITSLVSCPYGTPRNPRLIRW